MSESGIRTENPQANRRNIVKGGAAVTSGAVLGLLGTRELQIMEHGLETKVGTFFPLYERHDIGIQAKDIPQNLDAFFQELSLDESNFDASPIRLLNAIGSSGEKISPHENTPANSQQTELIKKGVLELLAQQGVR